MSCNSYDIDIRRNPYTEAPKELKDAAKDAMNTEWHLNEDLMGMIQELGKTRDEVKDKLKYLLGYKDVDKDSMSVYNQVGTESANASIERSIDALLDLHEELQERKEEAKSTGVYFDYFIGKNNRLYMDSTEVNPQSDKFHRFMFNTKKQETDIDMSNEQHVTGFKLAVAQAAGMGIDKALTKDAIKYANEVIGIQNFKSKVMKAIKSDRLHTERTENGVELKEDEYQIDGVKFKLEHLSHTLMMANEVEKWQKNKWKGKFVSNMTLETDALTSGFALKLLQMPLMGSTLDWLAKTGILVLDGTQYNGVNMSNLDGLGMNDIQSNKVEGATGEFQDSYRSVAKLTGNDEEIANAFEVELDRTVKKKEGEEWKVVAPSNVQKMVTGFGMKLEDGNVRAEDKAKLKSMFEAVQKLVPSIIKDGEVTSYGRNLFKYPFMMFNYGAGWGRIKSELAYGMLEETVQELINYRNGDMSKKDAVENVLNELDITEGMLKQLTTTDLKEIKNSSGASIQTMLESLLGEGYGNRVKEALETEFAPIVAANNAVNAGLKLMFRTYSKLLEGKVEAFEKENGGKEPTVEQEMEMFKELSEAFPIMKSPLGRNINEGIAIFKTKMDAIKAKTNAGTWLKKEAGQELRHVPTLRRYLDEAGAAGAVIPIHTLDASIMARTMTGKGLLNVFDAQVVGVGQVVKTGKEYNKNLVELSEEWSMLGAVHEAVKGLQEHKEYGIVFNDVVREEDRLAEERVRGSVAASEELGNLEEARQVAEQNRKQIFGSKMYVQNMVYDKNTTYMKDGKEEKIILGEVLFRKAEAGKSNDIVEEKEEVSAEESEVFAEEYTPKEIKEGSKDPKDYTNQSGGAYGADTFWGLIGARFGVKSNHFRADDKVSKTLKNAGQTAVILTQEQIEEGLPHAKLAAKALGKNFPKNTTQQLLLARNWFQVKNADAVYAIAQLDGGYVRGGTGYAVAMAVENNKPVFVFDPVKGRWYERGSKSWKPMKEIPVLTEKFAGIGTRDVEDYNVQKEGKWVSREEYLGKEVEERAKKAIEDVYRKTFEDRKEEVKEAVEEPTETEVLREEPKQEEKIEYGWAISNLSDDPKHEEAMQELQKDVNKSVEKLKDIIQEYKDENKAELESEDPDHETVRDNKRAIKNLEKVLARLEPEESAIEVVDFDKVQKEMNYVLSEEGRKEWLKEHGSAPINEELGKIYEDLVKKFGKENADKIAETMQRPCK